MVNLYQNLQQYKKHPDSLTKSNTSSKTTYSLRKHSFLKIYGIRPGLGIQTTSTSIWQETTFSTLAGTTSNGSQNSTTTTNSHDMNYGEGQFNYGEGQFNCEQFAVPTIMQLLLMQSNDSNKIMKAMSTQAPGHNLHTIL